MCQRDDKINLGKKKTFFECVSVCLSFLPHQSPRLFAKTPVLKSFYPLNRRNLFESLGAEFYSRLVPSVGFTRWLIYFIEKCELLQNRFFQTLMSISWSQIAVQQNFRVNLSFSKLMVTFS